MTLLSFFVNLGELVRVIGRKEMKCSYKDKNALHRQLHYRHIFRTLTLIGKIDSFLVP